MTRSCFPLQQGVRAASAFLPPSRCSSDSERRPSAQRISTWQKTCPPLLRATGRQVMASLPFHPGPAGAAAARPFSPPPKFPPPRFVVATTTAGADVPRAGLFPLHRHHGCHAAGCTPTPPPPGPLLTGSVTSVSVTVVVALTLEADSAMLRRCGSPSAMELLAGRKNIRGAPVQGSTEPFSASPPGACSDAAPTLTLQSPPLPHKQQQRRSISNPTSYFRCMCVALSDPRGDSRLTSGVPKSKASRLSALETGGWGRGRRHGWF